MNTKRNVNSKQNMPSFSTPYFEYLGGEWGNELNNFMKQLLTKVDKVISQPPTTEGANTIMRWALECAGLELVIPSFCFNYKLCLAPSIPRRLLMDIIGILPPNKNKAYELIVSYYEKKRWRALKSTVKGWGSNAIFRPRMAILNDCLDAHVRGKWTISIPTLLPQIEGIAMDIIRAYRTEFNRKSLVIKKTAKRGTAKTLPSQVFSLLPIDSFTPREMVAVYTLLYYLEGQLYSRRDFSRQSKKSHEPESLNRHTVLHGAEINYASKIDSLRCFLALDTLLLGTKLLPQA